MKETMSVLSAKGINFRFVVDKKYFFQLFLLSLCFVVPGFWLVEPLSGDEIRVAGISAEMVETGNYLIPTLNGKPFLEYPPMVYWLQAISMKIFEFNSFSVRLPSVIAGVISILLVYKLALSLKFKREYAFLSSIFLMFDLRFLCNVRECRVDISLFCFLLLSVISLYEMIQAKNAKIGLSRILFSVIGISGAFYSKGLLGLIFPFAVIGSFCLFQCFYEKKLNFYPFLLLLFVFIISSLICSIWYCCLYHEKNPQLFHEAFWVNNLGRFSGGQGDHLEPFHFYLFRFPEIFLPFFVLLLGGIVLTLRDIGKCSQERLFMLCYFIVPFFMFSVSAAKRLIYLLPLSVPCVLLSVDFLLHLPKKWDDFCKKIFELHPNINNLFFKLYPLILVIVFSILGCFFYHKILCFCCVGILLSFAPYFRNKFNNLSIFLNLVPVVFLLAMIVTLIGLSAEKNLRPLFEYCKTLEKQGKEIILVNPGERTRGAAFYYLRHNVKCFSLNEAIQHYEKMKSSNKKDCVFISRVRHLDLSKDETFEDEHKLVENPSVFLSITND